MISGVMEQVELTLVPLAEDAHAEVEPDQRPLVKWQSMIHRIGNQPADVPARGHYARHEAHHDPADFL
jgi:hypothetical protein